MFSARTAPRRLCQAAQLVRVPIGRDKLTELIRCQPWRPAVDRDSVTTNGCG
jgi:hypothetical protein